MENGTKGVILLAFGGADSPEAIEPFMRNLMGGRTPPPPLVEKIKARYMLIGGKSPLPGITADQAQKLENCLNSGQEPGADSGGCFRVTVGMRHWHPFVEEGVDRLLAEGAETIIAVSMAPFYSKVSTGEYREELERVVSSRKPVPEVRMARNLCESPVFIEAVAEKVAAGLGRFPEEKSGRAAKDIPVIFSAHSLPVQYIENGDPYDRQFARAAAQVAGRLGLTNWSRAYQSKGGGQGEWLCPMVEDVMDRLKQEGQRDVLIVPIGFVSDHIETLYDIDIAQKEHAVSLGLNFRRTDSLNTSNSFIRALAELVREAMS
ncbi:MAG: ferrochelatase [Firmicutes bacterium HGW-Firmicutes-14]|nr:MAG: ferrochelatase [Firmicutes bacterium HGW-Firmicutes-14]